MPNTPAIRLKRGEGRAFKAGGPWIYDNEIGEILGDPADGDIVRLEDYNGLPLGEGFLEEFDRRMAARAYAQLEQSIQEELAGE